MYNINPAIWGPHFWKMMHYITLAYSDTPTDIEKQNFKNFFLSIKHVIPCETCRDNFARHFDSNPLTDSVLSSRYNLINWLLNIHNIVNRETNQKEITYQEFLEEYNNNSTLKNNNIITLKLDRSVINTLLIVILIIIIIIYIKSRN